MVQDLRIFAEVHCSHSPSFDDDHKHHLRIGGYIFIGVISGLTMLLGSYAIIKMVSAHRKAEKDDKIRIGCFVPQLLFFILCITCSSMRVPMLHEMCNHPERPSAMKLLVVYATSYILQWALMVVVLFTRLRCIISHVSGFKWYTAFTILALSISCLAWITNCVHILTHTNEYGEMNLFLSAVSIGSLLACCKLLSIASIRALYRFHVRSSEFVGQSLGKTKVELLELVTKLTIITSLSTLSSALMCVCVAIGQIPSMNGDLIFILFTGQSVDVAGNCFAVYLAGRSASPHYKRLCAPTQRCCQGMCVKMAKRALKKNGAKPQNIRRSVLTIAAHRSNKLANTERAIAANIAEDAASKTVPSFDHVPSTTVTVGTVSPSTTQRFAPSKGIVTIDDRNPNNDGYPVRSILGIPVASEEGERTSNFPLSRNLTVPI